MEKSNHNTSLVLGEYIVSSYHVTFDEEIVLNIPEEKNNNTPTVAKREFNKVEKSAESKKADKVVISIVGVRGINIPEITNGQIYFLCTAIFDNDDVKMVFFFIGAGKFGIL
ncbi:hypothetical protein PFAG_03261 [Plasmodium falciparum Santa Lucia]|uniref:Uncharacterized protein n=1 Tax=Plasmodium falciparum Santa Lucia TaxID=478859 RepID=W7FP11_PLAFA|nr:hypothetical protein PFAG_03261 [Plasmodium falciparum Santa Lucia]